MTLCLPPTLRLPLLTALLAAPLLAAPAAAQEPLRNITDTLGITNKARDPIDYRERAPLVVPPGAGAAALRPPLGDAAARDPRWPVDPDLAKRRADADDARRPARTTERYDERQGAITASGEIRNGRRPRTAPGAVEPVGSNGDRPSIILDRNVLNVRNDPEEAPALPGEEPARRYLTDPPKGLRAPSKSAAFGATKERDFVQEVRPEDQLAVERARARAAEQ